MQGEYCKCKAKQEIIEMIEYYFEPVNYALDRTARNTKARMTDWLNSLATAMSCKAQGKLATQSGIDPI